MYKSKIESETSDLTIQKKSNDKNGAFLEDNRTVTPDQVSQLKKKNGKQQAGMPAKSKAGSKEKQQSVAQRAFNAFQSYRSAFFLTHGVSVKDVTQFLAAGNKLHGHGSADSNSKENPATTGDADTFIGWYRKKYGIEK